MKSLSKVLVLVGLLSLSCVALATPVQLGKAGTYTLLATGTDYYGAPLYGDVGLGSAAQVHGNVGARGQLSVGSGAVVYGDADYGSLALAGSIDGVQSQPGSGYFDQLHADLVAASTDAWNRTADETLGMVNTSTILDSGQGSVFDIAGLNLGSGQTLTLRGSGSDTFIINVGTSGFTLGGGSAIVLDGVSADQVLFNLYGHYPNASFSAAAGSLAGTFLAPDGYFTLGDGLTFPAGARFLGAGINANLQVIDPDTPSTNVPEPSEWGWMLLGMGLLGWMLLRRQRSLRHGRFPDAR